MATGHFPNCSHNFAWRGVINHDRMITLTLQTKYDTILPSGYPKLAYPLEISFWIRSLFTHGQTLPGRFAIGSETIGCHFSVVYRDVITGSRESRVHPNTPKSKLAPLPKCSLPTCQRAASPLLPESRSHRTPKNNQSPLSKSSLPNLPKSSLPLLPKCSLPSHTMNGKPTASSPFPLPQHKMLYLPKCSPSPLPKYRPIHLPKRSLPILS